MVADIVYLYRNVNLSRIESQVSQFEEGLERIRFCRKFPGGHAILGTVAGFRVLSALVPTGSRWFEEGWGVSSGFQHAQDRCGAAKEVEPTVVSGNLLIGSGAGTEEVAQLVVGATEFASRSWALEPAHRTVAAFDTRDGLAPAGC
jgi:hypothetical protein